jgi:hydrogenase maturation factor
MTADRPAFECDGHDGHCITCSDEAHPMVVVAVDEARGLALCESDDGRHETVEIALVAPVRLADRLLVHAGTAIALGEAVG